MLTTKHQPIFRLPYPVNKDSLKIPQWSVGGSPTSCKPAMLCLKPLATSRRRSIPFQAATTHKSSLKAYFAFSGCLFSHPQIPP
nr:hypothetical protein [uncultured Kingella sp.]